MTREEKTALAQLLLRARADSTWQPFIALSPAEVQLVYPDDVNMQEMADFKGRYFVYRVTLLNHLRELCRTQ